MEPQPSQFFPEAMEHVEIVCPLDSAYSAIKGIAQSGILQLLDLSKNSFTQDRRYTEMFLTCEEAERSIRYFEEHLVKYKLLPQTPSFASFVQNGAKANLNELAATIQDADAQLHEKISIHEQLKRQKKQLMTKLELIRFFRPIMESEQASSSSEAMSASADLSAVQLISLDNNIVHSVCGLVPAENLKRLENTIFRVSRRNAVFHIGQCANGSTLVPYCVFCSSETINIKIKKICECYENNVFEFPSSQDSLQSLERECAENLTQINAVDMQTRQINRTFLQGIAQYFWNWKLLIQREKQIWEAMDYGNFTEAGDSVIYRGWCPSRFINQIPNILQNASQESGSPVAIRFQVSSTDEVPNVRPVPSFIETNDFTYSFQLLNDAYGIPSYGEINGGAFYCMYPFLFGIMFGDIGHSIFYILATIVMFLIDSKQRKSGLPISNMGQMIRQFKYLLLFLSIASLYCGFLYNECFGLPIDFFGSKYPKSLIERTSSTEIYHRVPTNQTYPFGIDPVWVFKENELLFLNSFKMKLSIVIGMAQMFFGMILSLINHIRNKDYAELIVTWLPNVMYLVPFFGYLVVLIIKKWCIPFANGDVAPNLIQLLITMIIPSAEDPTLSFYSGQKTIQKVIIVIFFMSIPMCLLLKPIYLIIRHRGEPGFSFLEIFVMNLIHVIEFCLSALSHTASYLRLWALSLAHSQLSHVLWEQLFLMGANMNPYIAWLSTFIVFIVFAIMTVAILLLMEAFSALLHAIRLMWVEFSSKYYEGTGVAFTPLSLKAVFQEIGVR